MSSVLNDEIDDAKQRIDDKTPVATKSTVKAAPKPAASVDADKKPGRRFNRFDLLAITLFVLGGFYLRIREWLDLNHAIPSSHTGDPQLFEVMFAHAARVVTKFENPFFTEQLNAPDGVNMMANTSVLGLGIPLTPITLMFGPHTTFVLVATLSIAATAAAWYYVLSRTLVSSRTAAFIGGALAGFGPAMVSHNTVHINFSSQFLVPFIVWSMCRLLQVRDGKDAIRKGLVFAALVVYQFFIGEEVLLFAVFAAVVFMGIYAAMNWSTVRPRLRMFFTSFGIATATGTALLAYPLLFQFFGPQHYRGLPPGVETWGNEAPAFLTYSTESIVGALGVSNAKQISYNPTEQNSFFSFALLLVLSVGAAWLWHNRTVRAVAITGVSFAVLSLGNYLVIKKHETGIPLPWVVLGKLPLFDHIVPTRLTLVSLACAGVLVAMMADKVLEMRRVNEPGTQRHRAALVGLAALVLPLIAIAPTPISVVRTTVTAPDFVKSGQWRDYVDTDGSVVIFPKPNEFNSGMRWAASTTLEMPITMGYFLGPGPDGKTLFGPPMRPTAQIVDRIIKRGIYVKIDDKDVQQAREDVRFWRADVVVLGFHKQEKKIKAALDDLFGPAQRKGGLWVWDVRSISAESTR